VLGGDGDHPLVALRPHHDGVDDVGRVGRLQDLKSGLDGVDVGGVQGQGDVRNHFLNRLNHPRHQLVTVFFCRPQVDVDVVHSLFFLEKGLFLDRLGIPLLEGAADLG
jgi:hypothetical protein